MCCIKYVIKSKVKHGKEVQSIKLHSKWKNDKGDNVPLVDIMGHISSNETTCSGYIFFKL